MIRVEAVGQTYKQVQSFTYLEGAVTETLDMSVEIARRYLREISLSLLYDQPKVALSLSLSLKTHQDQDQDQDANGKKQRQSRPSCTKSVRGPFARNTTPNSAPYTTGPRLVSSIIGAQGKRLNQRTTSYNRALEITTCGMIESTLRTRSPLWAGTLIRMSGGRLPKRIVLGNLTRWEGKSG